MPLPYRDFYYPLNVFMHILTHEEGRVLYLHYGLFAQPGESIESAQERSTELLTQRLPPPPARVLDVGAGLGTTLSRLSDRGYDILGITPDEKQIAMIGRPDVQCIRFEDLAPQPFDAIYFQESSQYIPPDPLFAQARAMTSHVIVLDEFSLRPGGTLHSFDAFLEAAQRHDFRLIEEVDLTRQAAPTIEYFNERLERYREPLTRDLGITNTQVDDLIESGIRYRDLYRDGTYGYRLLQFSSLSRA